MVEGVDGLGHAVGCNIGQAKVAIYLVLALERCGEIEGRAICLDGIDRASELHEAPAQVAQGRRGIGVRLVDGRVAIGDAGVARVAKALICGTKRHVSLVGRCVRGVREGPRECGYCL